MTAIDAFHLEILTQEAFPPLETARLGMWRLAASSGQAVRINACWPLGEADRDLPAAVGAVEAWYAVRNLPSQFKVAEGVAPAGLEALLLERGYRMTAETLVMVGPVAGRADAEVMLERAPDERFLTVFTAAGGDAADAAERVAALGRMPQPAIFGRLDVDGRPAAIGACVVQDEWAGLYAMRTDARLRRRGLARRLAGALLAAAGEFGARRSYLQVDADNAPAIGLYASGGFTSAYRYRCWRRAA